MYKRDDPGSIDFSMLPGSSCGFHLDVFVHLHFMLKPSYIKVLCKKSSLFRENVRKRELFHMLGSFIPDIFVS